MDRLWEGEKDTGDGACATDLLRQWRNSGKGRFVWDLLDENGAVIGGNNEFEE